MRSKKLEDRPDPPPAQESHKEDFCLSRALHHCGQRVGRGFLVRNQNPKPVQCEIQTYTIFKCGYSQAKKFNIKTVKLLGHWQKQVQNHCIGAFPGPVAHSTPAGQGENLISSKYLEPAEETLK